MQGKIIKGIAGFYYVHAQDQCIYECKAKGIFRKDHQKPLVGDDVMITVLDSETKEGSITELLARRSEIFRPAVSNVDQVLLTFACVSPEPNLNLLDRLLVTMEIQKLPAIICFTKSDLASLEKKNQLFQYYQHSGYPIFFLSTREKEGLDEIKKQMLHRVSVLAGPSGVGKSTLLNALCPEAAMETGQISEKIKRGKHTTRHSELFYLGDDSYLFDTPGFSSLEFRNLETDDLELYFPEFRPFVGKCRFTGCAHLAEPGCAVKQALEAGQISQERYNSYAVFYKELKERKKY